MRRMSLKDKNREELMNMFSHIIDEYNLIYLKFKTKLQRTEPVSDKEGNLWLNFEIEGVELKILMQPKNK